MPMDLFQYDCYLHFLQFWETVWVGTRLIHVLELQIRFLRICNASRSACMSTATNKHCFMAVLDCVFSNEWTNKWSKWRGRKTKMSLCIRSYEGCELQNSRLPASMIKPPLQIVLISGVSIILYLITHNHPLGHQRPSSYLTCHFLCGLTNGQQYPWRQQRRAGDSNGLYIQFNLKRNRQSTSPWTIMTYYAF